MSGIGHVIDDSSTPTPTKHNLAVNGQAACLTWAPKKRQRTELAVTYQLAPGAIGSTKMVGTKIQL
jgi:hypothetical protein